MIDFIECEDVARYYERVNFAHRILDETRQYIIDTKTGKILGSVEDFRRIIENLLNSRFEVFVGVDAAHDLVFKCKECGTIVWGGSDHRLDPYIKCPHCQEYKTNLPYWTAEDIAKDPDKETDIATVMNLSEYWEFDRNRYREKRLHDWEYWRHKGKILSMVLTVNSVYYTGKKDLALHVWKTSDDYDKIHEIVIPLTLKGIYNLWIYPHTKKAKEADKLPF